MPKLPHLSGREIIRTLERMGFEAVRQSGSHVVMRSGSRGCVGLLRQAKVDVREFLVLL
jgi:predicted RNA binding protein YcfA (HicA-like mRNA interferase family)